MLSDSPSELAFIVGHELGHIYQQRTGNFVLDPDREWNADKWGLLMELGAGYDPYAGAGALGKLGMATATAGLQAQLVQNWEQMTGADAHGSFATRIDNLTTFIEQVCGYSATWQTVCAQFKTVVHPALPGIGFSSADQARTSALGHSRHHYRARKIGYDQVSRCVQGCSTTVKLGRRDRNASHPGG